MNNLNSLNQNDLYSILGLKTEATQSEIRKAYLRLSREYHPDKNDSPEATEKFQKINEAYEILGTEESRKEYDQEREAEQLFYAHDQFDFGQFFQRMNQFVSQQFVRKTIRIRAKASDAYRQRYFVPKQFPFAKVDLLGPPVQKFNYEHLILTVQKQLRNDIENYELKGTRLIRHEKIDIHAFLNGTVIDITLPDGTSKSLKLKGFLDRPMVPEIYEELGYERKNGIRDSLELVLTVTND